MSRGMRSAAQSHKYLSLHPGGWAEEHGYFGMPEVGKQPQHQPAPRPIEASPLEAFHQLSQGVDEAPGAPDTMELRKKKGKGIRCVMFQHDPAISSTISNVYGMHRSRERLTGNCCSSGKATLSSRRSGRGCTGEMGLLWPAPLHLDPNQAGEVGTEGPAGGTEIVNRLQEEIHVRTITSSGLTKAFGRRCGCIPCHTFLESLTSA